MATSTNSYATTTGIEALIGDLWVSRSITSTTIPTLAQIERQIDLVAGDINRELQAVGYAVPVSTGSADEIARQWLIGLNEVGTAARLLGILPIAAIAPENDDAGGTRMEMYQAIYNRGLRDIRGNHLVATRSRGRLSITFAGSQEDSDGNRKEALFRRGEYDSPGTRSLTE